jgi:hypothetical protein
MKMAQRTDTRGQTVFRHSEEGVTLDFVEEKKINFTLAAGSGWLSPDHWHLQHDGCCRINCLEGRMLVSFSRPYGGSGSFSGGPGAYKIVTLGDLHAWTSRYPDQELVVLLESEDEILWRNTRSAILDADRFPFLSSTPYWVYLLYSLLAFWPAARRLMIARFLWIQLQMMYFARDFRVHHGSIHAPYLWHLTHPYSLKRPPNWVFDLEWWSIGVWSTVTHRACYWLGRLFLGMKSEYLEYTPGDAAVASQNIKVKSLCP